MRNSEILVRRRRDRSNYTTKYVMNWRVVLKNTGVNAESLQVKRRRPQRCTETCQAGPVENDGVVGSAALELSGSWATRGTATHSSRLRAQRRQKFSRLRRQPVSKGSLSQPASFYLGPRNSKNPSALISKCWFLRVHLVL